MPNFLILGAGIGGLATAHALLRAGYGVQVYEAAAELREIGAGVVLGANAMRALAALGLHDAVRAIGAPLTSVRLLSERGRVLSVADTSRFTARLGYDNLAVLRADLQRILLHALPPGTVHLGHRLVSFAQSPDRVQVLFGNGTEALADALVAADGIRSRVRLQLLAGTAPRYAGHTCWRAVIDARTLHLPAGSSSETWGTDGRRFGLVPVAHGQLYWFACLNSSEPNSARYQHFTVADLQQSFRDFHAPIAEVRALTPEADLLWGDILDLAPLPSFNFGRVLLLGDAAHATTPNLGQGAGMAVEDAAVLARCLQAQAAPTAAFREFDRQRRPRTRRIIQQSRWLGQLAQFTPPWLVPPRDAALAAIPNWLTQRQLAWLYEEV